jgi:hypothetical protein
MMTSMNLDINVGKVNDTSVKETDIFMYLGSDKFRMKNHGEMNTII